MRLSNLRINMRFGIGFGALLLIIGLAVLVTDLSLRNMETTARKLAEENLPHALLAENMAYNVSQVQQHLTNVAATRETKSLTSAELSADSFRAEIRTFRELFRTKSDTKGLQEIDALEVLFNRFYDFGKRTADVYRQKGSAEGKTAMNAVDDSADLLMKKIAEFRDDRVREAQELSDGSVDAVMRLQFTLLVLGGIAVGFGVIVAARISRSIVIPVKKGVKVAGELAAGNLDVSLVAWGKDEMGQFLLALKSMVAKLRSVVAETKTTADNVAAALEGVRMVDALNTRSRQLQAVTEVSRRLASILDLDDLIGVFTHPQIVRNHNPGFPIFVNQLRIGLGHLKGSLSIQAGSWLIS